MYCITTALFKDYKKYIPGVIALFKSIKKYNNIKNLDVLCMCTPDVDDDSINLIKEYGNIKIVEYIKNNDGLHLKMKTSKQEQIYKDWIDVSYTKWNCLLFTEYDKILFMDADIIITNSKFFDIFNYNTPAGYFYSPWINYNYRTVVKYEVLHENMKKELFTFVVD